MQDTHIHAHVQCGLLNCEAVTEKLMQGATRTAKQGYEAKTDKRSGGCGGLLTTLAKYQRLAG